MISDNDLHGMVRMWKLEDRRPIWHEISRYSPQLKTYWTQWNSIILEDGLLKRVIEGPEGVAESKQIRVPQKRVREVLGEVHDGISGGYLSVTKTLQKVRERFYWSKCKEDVKDWCRKCVVCAASNDPPKAPMKKYNVGSSFEGIAIDVAGPFPETKAGNKYIIVVMDYFSKWAEAYTVPNQEATS